MKIILPLFLLALVSCTHGNRTGQVDFVPYKLFSENAPFKIDPAKPPEGMHMVQILLHHQGMLVEGTGCAGDYTHGHTLQNHLSMLLGLPVDSGDAMAFKLVGGCKTEWLKNPDGTRMDFWRCQLGVTNLVAGQDTRGVQISGDISFGVTQDKWEFIPEKLMCQ